MKALILLGFAALIVTACDPSDITGSGTIITQNRPLTPVSSVEYNGSADVIISYSETPSLRVEADDNLIDKITTSVQNERLRIHQTSGSFTRARIYVGTPNLTTLYAYGSGKVTVNEGFYTNTFTLFTFGSGNTEVKDLHSNVLNTQNNGSGNITVSGSATNHNCQIRASGSVHARDLVTRETAVAVYGSGNATVYASDRLFVNIMGAGNVMYAGNPLLTTDVKGSGRVSKL